MQFSVSIICVIWHLLSVCCSVLSVSSSLKSSKTMSTCKLNSCKILRKFCTMPLMVFWLLSAFCNLFCWNSNPIFIDNDKRSHCRFTYNFIEQSKILFGRFKLMLKFNDQLRKCHIWFHWFGYLLSTDTHSLKIINEIVPANMQIIDERKMQNEMSHNCRSYIQQKNRVAVSLLEGTVQSKRSVTVRKSTTQMTGEITKIIFTDEPNIK